MAKSIPGQSSMFDLMTSEDSSSAISSPASADGAMHFAYLDGLTTESAGRSHAPARSSRQRLEADRLRLICGRSSGASSLQTALACSLASKFPTREAGSMASAMTWKRWATQSGRQFCRLAVSASTMRALGFGLSATPTATANQACASMQKWIGCRGVTVTPASWAKRMGYPITWLRCLASAMPSSRKLRRSS